MNSLSLQSHRLCPSPARLAQSPLSQTLLSQPPRPRLHRCLSRRRHRLFFSSVACRENSVSDGEIAALASRDQYPLSLADLVKHGRPPLSEEALLSSANFTLSLLPIRLARRIQAIRNLPFIVVSNPNISKIYHNYQHSLSTLLPWLNHHPSSSSRVHQLQDLPTTTPIRTLDDETRFTETLAHLVATHQDTIPILARGFLECRRYISPADVTPFLDEHLRARIGTRLVAEQHIALHNCSLHEQSSSFPPGHDNNAATTSPTSSPASPVPTTSGTTSVMYDEDLGGGYIGVIDTVLKPSRIVESCAGFVADIAELRYGVRPRLVVDGEPDTTFAFVPMHLEYIVTELLKNAFRAAIENPSPPSSSGVHPRRNHAADDGPPVVIVTIAPEPPTRASQQVGGLHTAAKSPRSDGILPLDDNAPGVTIRIRDRGGGIAPDVVPHIWSYSFTTVPEDDDSDGLFPGSSSGLGAISHASAGGSSIAGLGYGLPLSRAYAEYFGGGITIQSLHGWGTDVYLRLKGVGKVE